jgi:hypothetical protein
VFSVSSGWRGSVDLYRQLLGGVAWGASGLVASYALMTRRR